LYVALTRPKEKLILTCVSAQFATQLNRLARLAALGQLPPYAMGSVHSPLAWVLAPLLRHPAAGELRAQTEEQVEMDGKAPDGIQFCYCKQAEKEQTVCEQEPVLAFADLPDVPPDLQYTGAVLSDIPAKLTATGLKKDYK